MTNSRLPAALRSAVRPLVCLLVAAAVFAAGSSVAARADQQLNSVAVKNDPATKRAPTAAMRKKLGIPTTTPNPYLSYLPVESRPNYELWRDRLHSVEVNRNALRKAAAQTSGKFLALLPVAESEGPAVRGVNDSQATAQFVGGFGTGASDDAETDVSGNLKTPDPVTAFTPAPEDDGDILQASNTTAGDGQAKTASGTVGDGPYGLIPTEVPIGSFPEDPADDDGDILKANVTGLATNHVVVADGLIGDGAFGGTTGDFDVFSFSVSANETIIIEVIHPVGDNSLDPILALVNGAGNIIALNDDGPFSDESYLNVTFNCPMGNCPTQTYYAFVGGWFGQQNLTAASFPSNRSASNTGPGAGDEGPYELYITRQITPPGDFDFYSVTANAGDLLTVEVDTSNFGDDVLDPIVAIYDSNGIMLALNDDDPNAPPGDTDSYLSLFAPQTDDYFIAVGGFDYSVFPASPLSFLEDPFDSSSGSGSSVVSTGAYDVIVTRNHIDFDYYAFDLQAGDIIGINITGAAPQIALFAENQQGLVAADFLTGGNFPAASPLPGGGDASVAYVVPEAGEYAVRVGFGLGPYNLELRAFRPPQEATGTTQRLFIDFNGASVNTWKFGAPGTHSQPSTLSPLASFLPAWGLAGGNENAVIDAILAVVEQNLSSDIRLTGNNPAFDIEILNSRDHADPFGEPDVSRIVVGGTILQSGISTIGIAQSIDIGNFEQAEDSLVLLDSLSAGAGNPNSLNSISLGTATKIELVGEGVGNVVAHEAGHFFANFHTDNANLIPNLMDTGGNVSGLVGVGDDDTFGSSDDVDVNFVSDEYEPSEGLVGLEDTKNAIAFGLTTGPAVSLDLTAFSDVSGDGVTDLASFVDDGAGGVGPQIEVHSGANGSTVSTIGFFNPAWTAQAIDSAADGNSDGTANDPALVLLGFNPATSATIVQVRLAQTGAFLRNIQFFNSAWTPLDIVVINDVDGNGNTNDAAVGVLGLNEATGAIGFQFRRLSNGSTLATHYFLNPAWSPVAAAALSRAGQTPLIAVMAVNSVTGATVVQSRQFSNGALQGNTYFFNTAWRGVDVAVETDLNSNGTANDPAWMVLATNNGTGSSAVQVRNVNGGAVIKTIYFLNQAWEGLRVTGAGDISGNTISEVAAMARNRDTGNIVIQVRDYGTTNLIRNIFP